MMLLPDTLIIHSTIIKKKVAQNSMDEILSKIFNVTGNNQSFVSEY